MHNGSVRVMTGARMLLASMARWAARIVDVRSVWAKNRIRTNRPSLRGEYPGTSAVRSDGCVLETRVVVGRPAGGSTAPAW